MNTAALTRRFRLALRPPFPVGSRRPQADFHKVGGITPAPSVQEITRFAAIVRFAYDPKWLAQSTPAQALAAADLRDALNTANPTFEA